MGETMSESLYQKAGNIVEIAYARMKKLVKFDALKTCVVAALAGSIFSGCASNRLEEGQDYVLGRDHGALTEGDANNYVTDFLTTLDKITSLEPSEIRNVTQDGHTYTLNDFIDDETNTKITLFQKDGVLETGTLAVYTDKNGNRKFYSEEIFYNLKK